MKDVDGFETAWKTHVTDDSDNLTIGFWPRKYHTAPFFSCEHPDCKAFFTPERKYQYGSDAYRNGVDEVVHVGT